MTAKPYLGIALMSAAMLSIPVVDGIAKHLSSELSPLYISWARYAVASLIVLPFSVLRHGTRCLPTRDIGTHVLRTVFLLTAMTLFFTAVSISSLATVTSASLIGPIVAAVLAWFFLGERLTAIRVAALLIGLAGALVILQPNRAPDLGVVLAMTCGVFFALYMITTRMTSRHSDPIRTLTFQCLCGMVLLLPLALWTWDVPDGEQLVFIGCMGLMSAVCHILSITAFRHSEASTLAPLVYLELVGSAAIGYAVFDEWPAPAVWLGAAGIVAAGLLLLAKDRQTASAGYGS